MGKTSEIEWTDATWNPWYGCRKISAGCKLCYAERDMQRYGRDFSKVTRAAPATFNAPLKWKAPLRIFTCSWSDFFIEEADPWRAEAWEIIRQTPQHTYMILTKRIDRLSPQCFPIIDLNVWLGVSAENQTQADKRIPLLSQIRATGRFVSYEPGLAVINFQLVCQSCGHRHKGTCHQTLEDSHGEFSCLCPASFNERRIDLVIIGGESARPRSRARPFHLEWAFDALAQCRAAGVACFIKQLGSNPYYHGQPLRLRDWKGGDMSEWPEGLRVRELPNAKVEV